MLYCHTGASGQLRSSGHFQEGLMEDIKQPAGLGGGERKEPVIKGAICSVHPEWALFFSSLAGCVRLGWYPPSLGLSFPHL